MPRWGTTGCMPTWPAAVSSRRRCSCRLGGRRDSWRSSSSSSKTASKIASATALATALACLRCYSPCPAAFSSCCCRSNLVTLLLLPPRTSQCVRGGGSVWRVQDAATDMYLCCKHAHGAAFCMAWLIGSLWWRSAQLAWCGYDEGVPVAVGGQFLNARSSVNCAPCLRPCCCGCDVGSVVCVYGRVSQLQLAAMLLGHTLMMKQRRSCPLSGPEGRMWHAQALCRSTPGV